MAQTHPYKPLAAAARDEVAAAADLNGRVRPAPLSPAHSANREVELLRVLGMTRVGALMIIAFQLAYLGWDLSVWRTMRAGMMAWHVGNIAVGVVALGLTLIDREWPTRHLRALTFWTTTAVVVGMARLGILTGVSEPLFVAVILFTVGTGATIPWEPRWQGLFNLTALVALVITVPHTYDGFNGIDWVAVGAAIGLSQVTNLTLMRFRDALQR